MTETYKTIDLITPLVKKANFGDLKSFLAQVDSNVEFNKIFYELKSSNYFEVQDCSTIGEQNLTISPNSTTFRFTTYEEYVKHQEIQSFHQMNFDIQNSQIGAIGENANSSNNTFQQNNFSISNDINIEELQTQLTILQQNLLAIATQPEDYIAIGRVAEAQIALKENDSNKAIRYLKESGKWVFEIAKEIGVGVVVELLTK